MDNSKNKQETKVKVINDKNILDIFKSGLSEFVEISVKQHHEKLLASLPDAGQCGYTTLESCFECNRKNLKPRHSNKNCPSSNNCFCKHKRYQRPCPNFICDYMCQGIIEDHTKYSPNFKTTEISQWTSNYWEVAKCYMEHSSESAATTGILDLLHLIANNRFIFQKVLQIAKDLSIEQPQKLLNKVIKICKRIETTEAKCTPGKLRDMCTFLSNINDHNARQAQDKLDKIMSKIDLHSNWNTSIEDERNTQMVPDFEKFVYDYFQSQKKVLTRREKKTNSDFSSFELSVDLALFVGETVRSLEQCDIAESNLVDLIYGKNRYHNIFVVDTAKCQEKKTNWSEKELLVLNILEMYYKPSFRDRNEIHVSSLNHQKERYRGLIYVSKMMSKRIKLSFKTICDIIFKDFLIYNKDYLVIIDSSDVDVDDVFLSDGRHTVVQLLESEKFRSQKNKERPFTVYVKVDEVVKITVKHTGTKCITHKEAADSLQSMIYKTVKKIGRKEFSLTLNGIVFENIATRVKLNSVSKIQTLRLDECAFTPVIRNVGTIEIISEKTSICYFLDQMKLILYPLLLNNTNPLIVRTSAIQVGQKSFCLKIKSSTMEIFAKEKFGLSLQNCSKEKINKMLNFKVAEELLSLGCNVDVYRQAVEKDKMLILGSIRYGLLNSNPNYVHVYPAKYKPGKEHCEDVVFVCFMKENFDIDKERIFETFRGFQTFQRSYNNVSSESFNAESSLDIEYDISKEQKQSIEETVEFHSEFLMKAHSNLEMICVSMGKVKDDKLEDSSPHIVLYVRLKSYIPIGENRFPHTLIHPHKQIVYPVDIREGYFACLADSNKALKTIDPLKRLESLVMGCSIGIEGNKTRGTLGPFVQIESGSKESRKIETGFLTACHIFGLPERLQSILDVKVVQPSDGDDPICGQIGDKVCGEVVACTYTEAVDAALVKITKRHPLNGAFITCQDQDCSDAGLTSQVMYSDGSISDPNDAYDKTVIKIGKRTYLTSGKCFSQATAIKLFEEDRLRIVDPMTMKQEIVVMKNMFRFRSLSDTAICDAGDSGAGVFLVKEQNKLSCIGMAIGKTSDGFCVATPIKRILEKLSDTSYTSLENLQVSMKVFKNFTI